jgi:membrane protein involved in colicin uptake
MSIHSLDRRDFSRLSLAALGGVLSGTAAVAQTTPQPIAPPNGPVRPPARPPRPAAAPPAADKPPADKAASDKAAADKAAADKAAADKKKKKPEKPKEIHICRGLNTCQGKGKTGDNKCAGQGLCATTTAAPHECAGANNCKGQGGCGADPGRNMCAGYGNGSVPILEDEWPRLRAEFEARMKRLKRPFGAAPLSENEEEWKRRKEAADAKAIAEAEAAKLEEPAPANDPKNKNTKNNKTPPKRPGVKDTAKPKDDATKPTKPTTKPPKPATDDGDTADILGELTGDKDKPKPKPAPKKPAPK